LKVFKKIQNEHRKWIPGKIQKDRGVVIYTTTITGTEEEEDQVKSSGILELIDVWQYKIFKEDRYNDYLKKRLVLFSEF
jgi:hypothetical protein